MRIFRNIYWTVILLFMCINLFAGNTAETDRTFADRTFSADTELNIDIHPKLTKTDLTSDQKMSVELRLMKQGYMIKAWDGVCEIGPGKVGKSLDINIKTALDFDYPTGEYYIYSPQFECEKLAVFNVQGMYPTVKPKEKSAENITVSCDSNGKAGKTVKFTFGGQDIKKIKSEKAIFIFEKAKDVAYYGASGKISGKAAKVTLPKTMPAGEYKVIVTSDKDYFKTETKINISSDYTESTTDLKPIAYGFHKDSIGFIHTWFGNQAGTMFWNGDIWMQMSGMFCQDEVHFNMDNPKQRKIYWDRFVHFIDVLESRGIKHIYITNLALQNPFYWETVFDFLESRGFTYVCGWPGGDINFDPLLTCRAVRADSHYAITDRNKTGIYEKIINSYEFECVQDEAYEVDYLVLDKKGNPLSVKKAETRHDDNDYRCCIAKIDLSEFKEPVDVVYSLRVRGNRAVGNPWAYGDHEIKFVREKIKQYNFRPGFRGFVDMILTNERGFRPGANMFIDTPEFAKDRAERLKAKYSDTENLKKAWLAEGDFPADFSEIAMLYPIYSDDKKIYLSDNKDSLYILSAKSPYWPEYLEMRDISYENLQDYNVKGVKEVCDVPVFIKAVCFREIYNMNFNKSRLGADAFGCELYHRGDALVDYGAGYRYAEKMASSKALISATTEMNNCAMPSMYPNYNNINSFFYDMSVTHYFGNKLTYLFIFDVLNENYFEKNRMIRDERMLEWIKIWNDNLNDKKDRVENFQPYVYCSWPQCESWEEKPSAKRSVQTADDALGTCCVKASNGVWVLNSIYPFESDVTFVTLHDAPSTDMHKEEFEKLKEKYVSSKGKMLVMLGLRKDLGKLSVDNFYKNEFFEDEDNIYQALNVPKGAKIIHETDGKVWGMIVGSLQIVACRSKFDDHLGDMVAFAQLPKAPKSRIISSDDYMKKILGLSFATYGDEKYKAVGTTLKGRPVTYIHTTDEIGGNTIILIAKKDCTVQQNISLTEFPEKKEMGYLSEKKSYKAGDRIKITFPRRVVNPHVGAGRGTVRIEGLSLNDLEFENIEKDRPREANFGGYEKSCVPDGMVLPIPKKIEKVNSIHMEAHKAVAAFNKALDFYYRGKYLRCEETLREYIGLATDEVYEAYCLMLGNLQLTKGSPIDAKNYLEDVAKKHTENKDLQTSYAVYLYLYDKEKAKEIWRDAGGEEALHNLSLAE